MQLLPSIESRTKTPLHSETESFVLDLSFGETQTGYDKVNLLGSCLNEDAIFSLILSLQHLRYLDLRGNNLNASFGWTLIKSMKKKYILMDYCNGVDLKSIRENKTKSLNLSNFSNHAGLFGIEVVGAIFLAHFLRQNWSLEFLCFRRNDVQKEGAKVLAQSIISNTKCRISMVNTMGSKLQRDPEKGVNFCKLRKMMQKKINLQNCLLHSEDLIFLEEWLLRFDCVEELDLSENSFGDDALQKLSRFICHTRTCKELKLSGVALNRHHLAFFVNAVKGNSSLKVLKLQLEAAILGSPKPENVVVMEAWVECLAQHPTLEQFGELPIDLTALKNNTITSVNSARLLNRSSHVADGVLFLALIAYLCPTSLHAFQFGTVDK
eukprot:Platyproteum_vivax@DN12446_c0_g1_i1.p1